MISKMTTRTEKNYCANPGNLMSAHQVDANAEVQIWHKTYKKRSAEKRNSDLTGHLQETRNVSNDDFFLAWRRLGGDVLWNLTIQLNDVEVGTQWVSINASDVQHVLLRKHSLSLSHQRNQRPWLLSTGSGMACMFTIVNFQGILVDSHQLGDICLQLKLKSHYWRHHHSSGGPRPIGSRSCLWGCTAFWPRWRNMPSATASQNR